MKTQAEFIRLIYPLSLVLIECSERSPEFLSEINPKKNGLNVSEKDGKTFWQRKNSLNFTIKE